MGSGKDSSMRGLRECHMKERQANREGMEFQKSWLVLKVWPLRELSSFIRGEKARTSVVSKYGKESLGNEKSK